MNAIKKSIFTLSLLSSSIACSTALAAPASNEISITIDTKKPGPVINKNIYGQFAEHLGTGVYEGMWVGPESPIPNTRGWRNDVIGALKNMHVPLVRWPGGCFADEYHWREGIGARENRPVKMNTNWGNVEERNAVGTHEFFDLADQLGADTYVNGNLGSGTAQEMAEWMEYMTGDGQSTLAELRRKNGHDKPFNVTFFGVGNEAWGCGGNMTVQHYTSLYNQYASFLKAPKEYMPKIIATGGHDDDTTWTGYLSKNIHRQWNMGFDGISFHYYTLPTGIWEKKGAATGFGEDQWISTLKNTLRMDGLIRNNLAKLVKNDPKNTLSFNVDEWGTWYDVEPGTNAGFLYQQNSLRDALVAALNFNIFHTHAERVKMTNIAQMVNVLQAMILTDKDKMLLTPTYHAFEMYVPFQNATSLPLTIKDNPTYSLGKNSIPTISASAARALDGKLYLSLVNTNPNKAVDVVVDVAGAKIASLKGRVLTAGAMDAHNTFADPALVKPASLSAAKDAKSGKVLIKVPAKAVVVVAVE